MSRAETADGSALLKCDNRLTKSHNRGRAMAAKAEEKKEN